MENSIEEGRGFRQRKKQTDPVACPICGITIRASEIKEHYEIEIERLVKLQLSPKLKKSLINGNSYHDPLPGCSSNGDESSGCPWITFSKIRNNRHSRLRIKNRKRKPEDQHQPVCPVCNERPSEDINIHVERCLRKSENSNKSNGTTSDDDESIDIEGESFEEYEWAGQKRIRASSLLDGGFSATGIGTTVSNMMNDDDDEDLNVDVDDTQIYGPPQYTEQDTILPLSIQSEREGIENNYLRELVSGQNLNTVATTVVAATAAEENSTTISNNNNSNNNSNNNRNSTERNCSIVDYRHNSGNIKPDRNNDDDDDNNLNARCINETQIDDDNSDLIDNRSSSLISAKDRQSFNQIIESLKSKIREYEKQINNKLKCLICMDEFEKPTVSICCWHVHCEECWLRTLGARKLCPRCNMITSPSDLRRIYM